ncbi:MAG TPA: SRPBCC family protein [Acidimicrobiales bacterium]|nr:SRPBCC family protein [Acidimicrobiales bacterium]
MTKLVPRTIEWIDSAPVRIPASARSTASPDAVFAVLAEHERWPEWFTSVKSVEVMGAPSGVGARRRVKVPGLTVDEEFIVWEPGVRWSFTGLEARPGITRSLVEDCRLTPVSGDGGGTDITYTMYLDPPTWMRPLLAVLAPQLRRNNNKAMENLARRAAAPPTA